MALSSSYPLSSSDVASEYGFTGAFSSSDLYGRPGLPSSAPMGSDDLLGASNVVPLSVSLSEDTTPYGEEVGPSTSPYTTAVTTTSIRATAGGGDWQGGSVNPVFTVEWLNGGWGAGNTMTGPGFFTVNLLSDSGAYERYSFTSSSVGASSYPYWSNFRVRCEDAAGNVSYSPDFYVEVYVNSGS